MNGLAGILSKTKSTHTQERQTAVCRHQKELEDTIKDLEGSATMELEIKSLDKDKKKKLLENAVLKKKKD